MTHSSENLQEIVRTNLADYLLVVVSNREPYVHTSLGDRIQCSVPASGLTMALDPIMRACGGVWVAHGSGDADRTTVDDRDRVAVPPDQPSYTLRRVWLSKQEVDGYYMGFSNEALWPLCHIAYTRPEFQKADWETYQRVNKLFADAVLDEIGDREAFVFIQDYHLSLLSKFIKSKNSKVITAQFWHIPWPNPETFRICPWGAEIIDGLLGNDLLCFHIAYHRNNFIETVERTLESRVDHERHTVSRGGKTTLVLPFPISVDFDRISRDAASEAVSTEIDRLRHRWNLGDKFVGVGIDRIDYTKGIPDRLKALDRFLSVHPDYLGKVVFFQLGEPSRVHIDKYKTLNAEVDDLVEEVNWKHQSGDWKPIIYVRQHLPPPVQLAYYRLANFCVVSSLHDGMNLVAKEFVSSRVDEDGVLVLTRFAGASRELTEAVLINPYAIDDFAEAIKTAIEMPKEVRQIKMVKLRNTVRENNIYSWAGNIISELTKLEFRRG